MRLVVGAVLGCALSLSACGDLEPKVPGEEKRERATELAQERRLKRACGSQETYDRLKAVTFDEATRVRRAESPLLDRLASASVVRMEDPVAKGRDETLNVTVCTGHLVLELPPGAEDAFDGDRRLEADVEYSAQEAADGSGLVYQIKGAEPIIYRLAALDMNRVPTAPMANPTATADAGATAPPVAPEAVPPAPAAAPAPAPAAQPTRVARPAPPRLDPRPTPRPVPKPTQVAKRPAPPPRPPVRPAVRPDPEPAPAPRRAATRPSFNCGYARSRVERLVCADEGLARADRTMSAEFYAALANADPGTRAELRQSRDRFLRYRDRCGSAGCVAQAYSDRVAEIRDIASGDY